MFKSEPQARSSNTLELQSGRKYRLKQLEPESQTPLPNLQPERGFAAPFGLMPLTVPYEDSPPEARILNAVAAGLVVEGRSDIALELGIPKTDFTRALRSLKNEGAIYVGPGGRYRLSFHTSNFPNIVAK
jgi:hypothetical protein